MEKMPTLAEHVANLKEQAKLEKQEITVSKLVTTHTRPISNKVIEIEKAYKKLSDRVDEIDVKTLNKFLVRTTDMVTALEDRIKDLDRMFHHLIHKETVLTEVSIYVRSKKDWALLAQFHLAIMKAYNQPNEWWHDSEKMLIENWYQKIMELHNEPEAEHGRFSYELV